LIATFIRISYNIKMKILRELMGRYESPPEKIKFRNLDFFRTLGIILFYGLLFHIAYFFLFLFLDVEVMYLFNILSVAMFFTAVVINRWAWHWTALTLAIIEIVIHQALCVYSFGLGSGFQFYILILPMLIYLGPYGNNFVKIISVFALGSSFIAIVFYFRSATPNDPFGATLLDTLNIINMFSAFLFVSLGALYFNYVAAKRNDATMALKVQQDADYYLTALLVKPLLGNFEQTSNCKTDFLSEQKKKFSFKQYSAEIGGDICLIDAIKLQGEAYTVFLNADAMGKSIQGAGGALVLGTVFKSILTQTKTDTDNQNQSSKQWLQRCYNQCQNVFISFEGSMLISAVIALVNDKTGLMHFINAEHPSVILYRDRVATFIDEPGQNAKIGVPFTQAEIQVNEFQLQDNDIVIAGSDGRDDIILDKGDSEKINDDEKLILKFVEESEGKIHKVFESITQAGNLTDDLSLLSLQYRKTSNARQEAAAV